jgi:hypothetical protein
MSANKAQLGSVSSDSVILLNEREAIEVVAQSVQALWEIVSNLSRLRPAKRLDFRVIAFGSARIPRQHSVTVQFATCRRNWR